MLEESIEFAETRFSERQLIEARNEADTILKATERTLQREDLWQLSREERAPSTKA